MDWIGLGIFRGSFESCWGRQKLRTWMIPWLSRFRVCSVSNCFPSTLGPRLSSELLKSSFLFSVFTLGFLILFSKSSFAIRSFERRSFLRSNSFSVLKHTTKKGNELKEDNHGERVIIIRSCNEALTCSCSRLSSGHLQAH